MWYQKTKTGKYQFFERYKDQHGKYHVVSVCMPARTPQYKKQAQQILEIKISKKTSHVVADLTLQQLADYYIEWQYENLKEQSAANHASKIRIIINMLDPDLPVSEITAALYRQKMDEQPTTYNERLTRFKAMIRWGYKNDLIKDISFLEKIQPKKDIPTRIKVEDKFLERDDLKKLIDGLPEYWALVTEFLALTGMRISELIDLKKKNVNIDERYIYIVSTFALYTQKSSSTKTDASNRKIYIQNELLPCIAKIKEIPNDTIYFMPGTDDGHISYNAYRACLRRYAPSLIGRSITPHIFRHTHTSLLAECDYPLDKITARLGHADSRITKDVYLHITERARKKDNQLLDGIKLL